MFLAVFDDNTNRLNKLVGEAVRQANPEMEMYVLGGRDYAYPTKTRYISLRQGGNYHDAKGVDNVTAVLEDGGPDGYFSYARPYADAVGTPGHFASLNNLLGTFAEYYPIGVRWADAIENAKKMKEKSIDSKNRFTHLLRNLFIDFSAQDGFSIDGIEVRVFDMQETMNAIASQKKSLNAKELEEINKPEVSMVLTANMTAASDLPRGWKEICVDFDEKFDGIFTEGRPSTNLLRANIVISRATPVTDGVDGFFGWTGNPSLANSVRETLAASSSNPQGRILYTYYMKAITE